MLIVYEGKTRLDEANWGMSFVLVHLEGDVGEVPPTDGRNPKE